LILLVAAPPTADPAWGFGLGGALFLLSLPALWAAIHLRGGTNLRLRQTVDLAYVGLAEQAIATFQILRSELDAILPATTGLFDPAAAIVDPSLVEKAAKRGIHVLKQRQKINQRFSLMLRVCSYLKYVAGAFTIFVFVSTCLYFTVFDRPLIWRAACWVTGAAAVLGLALIILYTVLETRIEASIEESDPVRGSGVGGTP